jgi:radical SAM-linked protein
VPERAGPGPAGTGSAAGPTVQHLVVRYAKRGKMRFASHRDVARAFERGVRRAGLPIAYSAGFTPHPRLSYPGGAPTGVASEAEYLSLALTDRRAEAQVCQRLNAALPDGIDVIDVIEEASGGSASFGDLEASEWRVVLPGVAPAAAQRAVAGFLALGEAPVERLTDKGVRRLDARAAVVEMNVVPTGPAPADPDGGGQRAAAPGLRDCAILRMIVLNTAPAVRPEDVVTALRGQDGIEPSSPPMTTRLAQGPLAQLTGTTQTGAARPGPKGVS